MKLRISASYDADIDRVKTALRDALDTVGGFYEDPPYFIHVKGYGESAIEYSVRAYCKGDDYWEQYYALLEEIKRTFDKNGIPMTYPLKRPYSADKIRKNGAVPNWYSAEFLFGVIPAQAGSPSLFRREWSGEWARPGR